ncbi:hypothetical protein EB796_016202 [Bugula neritina]|uniref:C2H2-type domain-containing protein n=1 Tax=Bugula neritina TaxID=10212 RepID=A0A7J7JJC1_BUGNE|nr:hypothetical protein EB796_016202 [Bugula neritina]
MMTQQPDECALPLDLSVKTNHLQEVEDCKPNLPIHLHQSGCQDNLQALDLRIHQSKKNTAAYSDIAPTFKTYWQFEDPREFSFYDYNSLKPKDGFVNIYQNSDALPDYETQFLVPKQLANRTNGRQDRISASGNEPGIISAPQPQAQNSLISKQCPESTKTYTCEMCSKSYKQVRDYRAHVATHENGKIYTCDICFLQLRSPTEYLHHLQDHQQKGLDVCVYCKKYFRDKCTLFTHMRTHTGEKPYQCDVCGKRFRQSGTCRRHRKIHEL